MPEIGEVARIVSRLRHHLEGKTIAKVVAVEDKLVFKDTTHKEIMAKISGKQVVTGMSFLLLSEIVVVHSSHMVSRFPVQQWGKYFWYAIKSSEN